MGNSSTNSTAAAAVLGPDASTVSSFSTSVPRNNLIREPHDHDVLSGRGNYVNYHPGNEHFRTLVRKYKKAYVACPKPQKGKFSKIIYDEIRGLHPPGRFLKQDMQSKLWYDIGEKKALDKTRQALREGAPELMKELEDDQEEQESQAPGKITNKPSNASSMPQQHHQNTPSVPSREEPNIYLHTGSILPPQPPFANQLHQSPFKQGLPQTQMVSNMELLSDRNHLSSFLSPPLQQRGQLQGVPRSFSAPLTIGPGVTSSTVMPPFSNRMDQLRNYAANVNLPYNSQGDSSPVPLQMYNREDPRGAGTTLTESTGSPLQSYVPSMISKQTMLHETGFSRDQPVNPTAPGPTTTQQDQFISQSPRKSFQYPIDSAELSFQESSMGPAIGSGMSMEERRRIRAAMMQQRVHPHSNKNESTMGANASSNSSTKMENDKPYHTGASIQGAPSSFVYRTRTDFDEDEEEGWNGHGGAIVKGELAKSSDNIFIKRQSSERSIGLEGMELKSNHSTGANSILDGDMSNMSLSVSGINPAPSAEAGGSRSSTPSDPNDLSGMFNNSLKLNTKKKNAQDLTNVMNMSVLSMDENYSEFEESGITRMEASFSDVFEH